jgi:hypothetical protein
MNPVEKVLWFVETHHAEGISLETIAAIAVASRHHGTPSSVMAGL